MGRATASFAEVIFLRSSDTPCRKGLLQMSTGLGLQQEIPRHVESKCGDPQPALIVFGVSWLGKHRAHITVTLAKEPSSCSSAIP